MILKILKSVANFFLRSSEDPNKLSLTLQGLMGTVASLLGFVAAFHGGQPFSLETQNIVVQNAVITVTSVGAAFSSLAVLFGLFRKFFNQFKPWNIPTPPQE